MFVQQFSLPEEFTVGLSHDGALLIAENKSRVILPPAETSLQLSLTVFAAGSGRVTLVSGDDRPTIYAGGDPVTEFEFGGNTSLLAVNNCGRWLLTAGPAVSVVPHVEPAGADEVYRPEAHDVNPDPAPSVVTGKRKAPRA